MLTRVTLTGADDSVDPRDLIALATEFPFVEFGILIGSKCGIPRFPSSEWFASLHRERLDYVQEMPLSLHVCGQPLRSILNEGSLYAGAALEPNEFGRMQLNFAGEDISQGRNIDAIMMNLKAVQAATMMHEIIIQLDGINDWLLDALLRHGIKASGLYDRSHGTGMKPDAWPKPNPGWEVGYAGGLSPENVVREVKAMFQVAGGQRFWIDQESSLRSTSGGFDLGKCLRVLEQCAAFIRS